MSKCRDVKWFRSAHVQKAGTLRFTVRRPASHCQTARFSLSDGPLFTVRRPAFHCQTARFSLSDGPRSFSSFSLSVFRPNEKKTEKKTARLINQWGKYVNLPALHTTCASMYYDLDQSRILDRVHLNFIILREVRWMWDQHGTEQYGGCFFALNNNKSNLDPLIHLLLLVVVVFNFEV